jgi:hypothetical protein
VSAIEYRHNCNEASNHVQQGSSLPNNSLIQKDIQLIFVRKQTGRELQNSK